MKQFYVYITCSGRNGTLYIGITSDLNSWIPAFARMTSQMSLYKLGYNLISLDGSLEYSHYSKIATVLVALHLKQQRSIYV